jgi:hypothetical protein
MLINYLTGTDENAPILSFGQPFRVGSKVTGTVFITSSVTSSNQLFPGVIFSHSRVVGDITGSCYLYPVFPGFELPAKFNLEMSPQRLNSSEMFFLAFGTELTGSTFSGLGFTFAGNRVFTFTTGTVSSSTVPVLQNLGFSSNIFGANYLSHEIEFKSNVVGTGSNHLTFRDSVYTTSNTTTNVVFSVFNSRTIFPNIDQFLTATHGQVFNRLYFGFTSQSDNGSTDTRFDLIRIKKNIMDWE